MFLTILIITQEDNEVDAVEQAKYTVSNYLCGVDKPFDCYGFFDDPNVQRIAGNFPVVERVCNEHKCDTCEDRFKCHTQKVSNLVELMMRKTKDHQLDACKQLRKLFNRTGNDNDLLNDKALFCNAAVLSSQRGINTFCYDVDGNSIKNTEELKVVLSYGRKNYAVPVVVHV